MRREYSSLSTGSVRQCSTCYGGDGTIASRSIDTEQGSAALVLARKTKGNRATLRKFSTGRAWFSGSSSSNVRCHSCCHIVRPVACIGS